LPGLRKLLTKCCRTIISLGWFAHLTVVVLPTAGPLLLLLLQMLSLAQAAEWLSGEANIPPSPALDDTWTSAAAAGSTSMLHQTSTSNSSSSLGMGSTTAADAAKCWRGQQQQRPVTPQWQQQQQQQGWICPADASRVVTSGSSSISYGHFAGSYIPSSLAAVQTAATAAAVAEAGSSSSSSFSSQVLLPNMSAIPGTPLNALPVLPQHPSAAAPSSNAAAATAAVDEPSSSSLQQQVASGELALFRDLAAGYEGLQLLLQCSLQQQQQQQQVCRLLVAQGTPAEQVVAGEAESALAGQ
jgi:hypothetical protein